MHWSEKEDTKKMKFLSQHNALNFNDSEFRVPYRQIYKK